MLRSKSKVQLFHHLRTASADNFVIQQVVMSGEETVKELKKWVLSLKKVTLYIPSGTHQTLFLTPPWLKGFSVFLSWEMDRIYQHKTAMNFLFE